MSCCQLGGERAALRSAGRAVRPDAWELFEILLRTIPHRLVQRPVRRPPTFKQTLKTSGRDRLQSVALQFHLPLSRQKLSASAVTAGSPRRGRCWTRRRTGCCGCTPTGPGCRSWRRPWRRAGLAASSTWAAAGAGGPPARCPSRAPKISPPPHQTEPAAAGRWCVACAAAQCFAVVRGAFPRLHGPFPPMRHRHHDRALQVDLLSTMGVWQLTRPCVLVSWHLAGPRGFELELPARVDHREGRRCVSWPGWPTCLRSRSNRSMLTPAGCCSSRADQPEDLHRQHRRVGAAGG